MHPFLKTFFDDFIDEGVLKRKTVWKVKYSFKSTDAISGKEATLSTSITCDTAEETLVKVAQMVGDKQYTITEILKVTEVEFRG